jgi:hypothetical protein
MERSKGQQPKAVGIVGDVMIPFVRWKRDK